MSAQESVTRLSPSAVAGASPTVAENSGATLFVAGFVRNFWFNLPNVLGVLGSAIEQGPGLKKVILFLETKNPGSKTRDQLEEIIAAACLPTQVKVEVELLEDTNTDQQVLDIVELARFNGNPYPDRSEMALFNSVKFMRLLENSVPIVAKEPRTTFFCRSDLLVLGKPKFLSPVDDSLSYVRTPKWHRWSGVNDRFAVVPSRFADQYFGRLRIAKDYLSSGAPLHGEKFLQFALRSVPHRHDLDIKLLRTRSGAVVVDEDFASDKIWGRLRRNFPGITQQNPALTGLDLDLDRDLSDA